MIFRPAARSEPRLPPPPEALSTAAFAVAAVLGAIHAGFSFFWALGGTWLVWSLGSDLVARFADRTWVLIPIGAAKLVCAIAPLVLSYRRWPLRSLTRTGCWGGAALLLGWGGLNTAVGNLVLFDVISPASGFDRPGMIGHAYLWDPLFLVWGVAVTIGLISSRRTGPESRRRSSGTGPLSARS